MPIDLEKDVEAATAKGVYWINLATHPLTNNAVYDAEDSFSPDGKWI